MGTNGQRVATPSASPHGGPYTVTIFANPGSDASSVAQQASSGGFNFGHVFVGLTNGDKQMYLGYYGDPTNPARGQLRVDADLAANGWLYKKTYEITEQGYRAAHEMIDTWGAGNQRVGGTGDAVLDTALNQLPIPVILNSGTWRPWCNCGDFAQAIATAAGVQLPDVPKELGLNTPRSWAQYLRDHGGVVNPERREQDAFERNQEIIRRETLSKTSRQVSSPKGDLDAYHKAMDQCRRADSPERSRCISLASGPGNYFEQMKAARACLDAANAALKACSDGAAAKYAPLGKK
jgi:hypothetical protein